MTEHIINESTAFGQRLREERKRLGIAMDDLSQAGSVSRASQSNYETGRNRPDSDYLCAVAEAGLDVVYLLTGRRSKSQALQDFDWEAHNEILAVIDERIDKEGLDIPFAKKMALLRVAMIHLDAGKGSHTEVIGELLRLIA